MTRTAIAEQESQPQPVVAPDTEATEAAAPRASLVPEIVRRRLVPFEARLDAYSWIATGLVTAVAAILRLINLDRPPGKMFDELYYATEAQALLLHGVEWDLDNNTPKYVVHPPLGKWCIALGEKLFGYNEFGWRISAAVAGIVAVLLIMRIARRMFGSTVLGCAAGLLMALDGMQLVMSRAALLDIFLMLFVLAAFGCLLIDRDQRRRRWLRVLEDGGDLARPGLANRPRWNWRTGVPWWRLASAMFAGCAVGVKWSAAFYLPVLALLVLFWEVGARKSAGVRRPWLDALPSEIGWGLASFGVVIVTYLGTWTGWFLTDDGYGRHRLLMDGKSEPPIIGALANLMQYHRDAFGFHSTLQAHHPYQSWPWQWLLLGRPVAFYWSSDGPCSSNSCASEVLLLGTPILWWSFILVLPLMIWFGIARRDWRMPAIALGIAGGFLPWFYYALDKRTMFYFYALPAEPFLILATVYVLGALMTRPANAPPSAGTAADRVMVGAIVAGGYVLAVGLCFAYFYPIYTGQILSYTQWAARMWLGNRWI